MAQIKYENGCTGICSTCGKCTVDFSSEVVSENMDSIKVMVFGSGLLGSQLFDNVSASVSSMGPTVSAEYVSDIEKISEKGFIQLPALAINGKIVSQGKILSPTEISSFIIKFI